MPTTASRPGSSSRPACRSISPKGVTVPHEAIQHSQDGLFVFAVKPDKTAERRDVQAALRRRQAARRAAGVNEGEQVVTAGQSRVGPGTAPGDGGNGAAPPATRPERQPMSLSSRFIRKPIATSLMIAAIVLAGAAAYPVPARRPPAGGRVPDHQRHRRSIPAPAPQTMATAVATPLETQFGQIPGLAQMTSINVLGSSQITLQFDLSRNIDGAATDVLEAINAAGGQLPKDIPNPPTLAQDQPGRRAHPHHGRQLRHDCPSRTVDAAAENIVAQQLSQVTGVSQVLVGGQQTPAVRVQVDPASSPASA